MTSTTSSSVVQNAPHIKYCTHARQLRVGDHPICTVCGAEMNSLPPRTRELYMRAHTVNGGVGVGGGLPPGLRTFDMRGGIAVTVTDEAAASADAALLGRLRSQRKLSLLLDLDQTLIHATHHPNGVFAETGAGHPSHTAAPPGELFRVLDGPRTYWIKVRPGCGEFLREASKLYELHVDTAGLKSYAESILQGLDPGGSLFGDRVTARDHKAPRKGEAAGSRKQVFWAGGHRALMDDSMSLIVDDNARVWGGSGSLVHIEKYVYWRFGGRVVNNAGGTGPADIGGGEESTVVGLEGEEGSKEGVSFAEEPHPYLLDVLRVLKAVHAEWYAQFDSATARAPPCGGGGGGGEVCGSPPLQQQVALPSTAAVLSQVLSRVFSGEVCAVLSGVFPPSFTREQQRNCPLIHSLVALGGSWAEDVQATRFVTRPVVNIASAEAAATRGGAASLPPHAALQAAGAELSRFSRPVVTHLVASEEAFGSGDAPGGVRPKVKVLQALKDTHVRLVPLRWLQECIKRYSRLPEEDFFRGAVTREHTTRPQDARVRDLLSLQLLAAREARLRRELAESMEEREGVKEERKEDTHPVAGRKHPRGSSHDDEGEEESESDDSDDSFGKFLDAL